MHNVCVFIAVPDTKLLGPVRNPVLQQSGACFPWFLPKLQGGWCKTEPPAHQDLEPTQGGAGTREEPGTSNTGCLFSLCITSHEPAGLCSVALVQHKGCGRRRAMALNRGAMARASCGAGLKTGSPAESIDSRFESVRDTSDAHC